MAMLPEGWSAHDLGDLAQKIEGGGTPPRNEPSYWDGDIPWASVKDLRGVKLSTTEECISELGLENSSSKLIPSNTMIIASRMAVGKAVLFNRDVAINQDLKAFYPKKNTDGLFLLQWYLSQSEKIESLATGSTVKGIRLDDLTLLPIDLPPLPEQQKIATILSSVDDVIEKTRAQIDKLKDLKTGMMHELLINGVGHTEFKSSPVGRIPAEWGFDILRNSCERVCVGFVGTCEKYYRLSGIPMIRTGNLKDGYLDLTEVRYVTPEFHYKEKKSQLKEGDLLIARHGNHGAACLVPANLGEANCLNVVIVRANKKIYFPLFLKYFFNSDFTKAAFSSRSEGSTQTVISTTEIGKSLFPIPTLTEQKKIADILLSIDLNIDSVEARLAQYMCIKKALMQDLLTGKVRVKVEATETAE